MLLWFVMLFLVGDAFIRVLFPAVVVIIMIVFVCVCVCFVFWGEVDYCCCCKL